ncbi:hypothetical protein BD413DRAFT_654563, partial [Trametes elegans]
LLSLPACRRLSSPLLLSYTPSPGPGFPADAPLEGVVLHDASVAGEHPCHSLSLSPSLRRCRPAPPLPPSSSFSLRCCRSLSLSSLLRRCRSLPLPPSLHRCRPAPPPPSSVFFLRDHSVRAASACDNSCSKFHVMAGARKPHYCRSCKDPEGNRVPLKGHRCPLRGQPFSVARTPPSEAVDSHVNTPPSSPIVYTSPTSSSSPSAHALTPAAGSSNPSPRYINMSISDLDDFMNSLHTLSSSPVNSPSHPSSPVPYTPKPPPAIGSTELSTPPFNCFLVDGMQTLAVSDGALNAGDQAQNVMSNSAATSPNDDLNMYFHMESSPNRTV